MSEALVLDQVSVHRGGRTVLHEITLQVDYGSILAVLGPNGAGKTTLLDTLAGFVPFRGSIRADGKPFELRDGRARAQMLTYVPQVSRLDSPMRVRDVVGQGRFAHRDLLRGPTPADLEAIAKALAATDTERFAERPFTALSHGERRRVLVARALATEAPILLLDEPTSALDISQSLLLFALLRRLATEGRCIVVVLHVLDEAQRCADRALLLSEGRVAALGPTREVIAPEPVARVYGVQLTPGGGFGYSLRSGET